jgi:pimeloyl-ACP methyl ester carboxylesterase
VNQQIRFCQSADGTRIAYALTGDGPPLVKAPHWLTHLEYEFESPLWRPWITALSRRHSLLRMDERGCGLSDWDVGELSLDAYVQDLEAVVNAAGLERFALFGHSQGGAIAVKYAVRNPDRVTHLVLLGGYARGWLKRGLPAERVEELHAQLQLIASGWGRDDPSYRQMFASQFIPGGGLEALRSFSELQRVSTSPANAVRIVRSFFQFEVSAEAAQVRCPALVMQARGDLRTPFEEGRRLASLIPGARFVPLDSVNHALLEDEPAFERFFEELYAFVPGRPLEARVASFADLTGREAQVLERIAQGLDNAQIAAHLAMSEKTVRNHITRIFDKLGVENRPQAIVLARERGMGQR